MPTGYARTEKERTLSETWGRVLRDERKRLGLTQGECGSLINAARQNISMAERGLAGLSAQRRYALAVALDSDPLRHASYALSETSPFRKRLSRATDPNNIMSTWREICWGYACIDGQTMTQLANAIGVAESTIVNGLARKRSTNITTVWRRVANHLGCLEECEQRMRRKNAWAAGALARTLLKQGKVHTGRVAFSARTRLELSQEGASRALGWSVSPIAGFESRCRRRTSASLLEDYGQLLGFDLLGIVREFEPQRIHDAPVG